MRRTWFVFVVLAVFALPSSGSARSAMSAVAIHGTAPVSKHLSNAALASRLAAMVYGARSNATRYRALLEVMRAIHLGVYTGKGKPVVRGAERMWRDFYLYAPEVQALARTLQSHDRTGAAALVASLTAAGVGVHGRPMTPSELTAALSEGVRQTLKHPSARGALVGLLVRDLGLRHRPRQELARAVSAGALALDPLQALLVRTSLFYSAAHERAGARFATAARAFPIRALAECPGRPPGVAEYSTGWNWLFHGVDAGVGVISGQGFNPAAPSAVEGLLESFHIVYVGDRTHETHYGPAGHAPLAGKQLKWDWLVVFEGAGNSRIDCGYLAGTRFPDPGPVAGVRAELSAVNAVHPPSLDRYGTLGETPSASDGHVTVVFRPNDEQVPGFGQEITVTGEDLGEFNVAGAFDGLPAAVAKELTVYATGVADPRQPVFKWSVSRHAPRGFQFGPVTANEGDYGGLPQFTEHVSGHVCGENPFEGADAPWDAPFDIADSDNGTDEAYDLTEPLFGAGIQGEATGSQPALPPDPYASHYPDMFWYAPRLTFLTPGPNPQMRIERLTDGELHIDTTVPITEDMSCPAPTP